MQMWQATIQSLSSGIRNRNSCFEKISEIKSYLIRVEMGEILHDCKIEMI